MILDGAPHHSYWQESHSLSSWGSIGQATPSTCVVISSGPSAAVPSGFTPLLSAAGASSCTPFFFAACSDTSGLGAADAKPKPRRPEFFPLLWEAELSALVLLTFVVDCSAPRSEEHTSELQSRG